MDVAPFSLFQWCFVFWTLPEFQMTEIETIYVTTGSDVKIKCPNAKVNTWQYFESKEVLALCGNGQNKINPNLTAYDRLNVSSDCQLLIQNLTTKDLCTYFCWEKKNDSKVYKIHVKLRNLEIDGTDNFGVIQGTEGENLTLRCTIAGFLPGDTTYWTTDNKVLVSGNTRSLSHTLTAHRSYNMKEFTCTTKNSNETHPLIAHVQLNLLLKPSVLITVSINSSVRKTGKDITVRQGQDMKLQCEDKRSESRNVEIFTWLFNGNVLEKNTNVITFKKIKSERSGQYTCMASNKAGKDSDAVNIIVTYPPIVWTKDITFNGINRPRTLRCNVSGEPNTYNITWCHYTNNNQLVRMFNTSSNEVLILPEGEANDLVFEDSGFYKCNVTNGIPDESGKLWQSEEIKVIVEGKPVLAKPKKSMFIGHFNGTSSISLFVLSSSIVTQAEWKDENGISLGHQHCSSTVNKTLFYGQSLNVPGYRCVYQIQNTREEDFQIYTVELVNKNGRTIFDISLVSSRAPEVPEIIDVYQKQNYIVLEWKPKFDGGAPQGFIVQYRKKEDEIWESILIQSNETDDFFHIWNPQSNTEYVFRMLAFNRIGNSSFTVQSTVLTDDEKINVWIQFKFLLLSIAVLLPACLVVLFWRYRQARKTVPNNSQRRNSNPAQVVAIGNDIDISANRDDVYSSIDSRRQILDKQQVTYKVTGKGKGGNKSDCENVNQRRNRNRKHDSTKLNYIEIAFDTVTNKREFRIHGADNRTPYADIDFTAKADPIISSDESEDSSSLNENNENDFVSLEDVQQWNIHSK